MDDVIINQPVVIDNVSFDIKYSVVKSIHYSAKSLHAYIMTSPESSRTPFRQFFFPTYFLFLTFFMEISI